MQTPLLHILALFALASVLAAPVAMAQQSSHSAQTLAPQTLAPMIRAPTESQPSRQKVYQRTNMGSVFGARQIAIQAMRFESMEGLPPFILDNTGSRTLFRYESGGEVLVLTQIHTTRGDTLYKNDQGMVILRLHRVGSATVFPQPRSQGVMAWSTGSVTQLGPPRVSIQQMTRILERIADDLAKILDQDLTISVTGATEETAWIYLDAANNIHSGIRRMMRHNGTLTRVQPIRQIEIIVADRPSSEILGTILRLSVTPHLRFSGRLSSLQIQMSLQKETNTAQLEPLPELVHAQEIEFETQELVTQESDLPVSRAVSR